ncbi:LysR substrate-binding domain-containing protein [Aestuariispira insulae]|uniref:DNA-binding transcriptional LysR family regulator n=1 Tax=Aestuariispira insulae TaxID=1461337 RepID=A0A3D9H6G9_9PROT|nr:LysR substrate-binding domain-containing protein [Aestuariispira insulae]RED45105.1 DNA-binding transcriptional LysR family regulator [Aestuariispira insulae]
MKLPPLNALRAFECAARHLSFSKAGDELCVTHAAISHQIKLLESWFARPLFVRENRQVRLNHAGTELYEHLAHALPELARLCHRLKQGPHPVKVGCIPSIASRWLIPGLPDFNKKHPEIQVSILYARAEEKLTDGDYDLLVTFRRDPDNHTNSMPLFSRASRPVCSPHYLAGRPKPETADAILRSDLLHDENERDWRDWANAAGTSEQTVADHHGPVFQDSNLMMTAVIAGHGIALCPVDIFRTEIDRGDLVVLSDIATRQDEHYYLIEHQDCRQDAKTVSRWFLDYIHRQI